jgi:hypothetical protein
MRYLRHSVFIALFFVAAACGSKTTEPGDTGDGGSGGTTLANGSMSGSIAGSSFSANSAIAAIYIPGAPAIISIAGGDTQGRLLGFALALSSTGTFNINDSSGAIFLVQVGTQQWQADAFSGGSGTVTFTTFTASHSVGSFSFTGNPVAGTGATGTKAVTGGAFNVTY